MKRSINEEMDAQDFQRWKAFKRTITNCSNQSDEEKMLQFAEFKEYENLNNNYNKLNPDLLMQTPETNMQSSVSSNSSLSRTSTTESSNKSESSKKSSSYSDPNKKKSDGHRQFQLDTLLLTPEEFQERLESQLPEDVMMETLVKDFLPFSAFRGKYILPMASKYKGQVVELRDVSDIVKLEEFMPDYQKLFIAGCHVTRKGREEGKKGEDVIPDTPERIMFRHCIKDLWEKLGMNYKQINFTHFCI